MLTNWIPKESLAELNQGFVVAIMLEAKDGEAEALATILRDMTPPTMAEPGVKLFLPYRSPGNPALFFVFELYVDQAAWGAHEQHGSTTSRPRSRNCCRASPAPRARVPFIPFL